MLVLLSKAPSSTSTRETKERDDCEQKGTKQTEQKNKEAEPLRQQFVNNFVSPYESWSDSSKDQSIDAEKHK
jgi:hypothetical protein